MKKSALDVFNSIQKGPLSSKLKSALDDIIGTFRDKGILDSELRMVVNTYLMDFIKKQLKTSLGEE